MVNRVFTTRTKNLFLPFHFQNRDHVLHGSFKIFSNVIIHKIWTCCKKLCFNLDGTWCGRRVSPAVGDRDNQSHQFLRPRHTTTTTDHYIQKNPFSQQYRSSPAPRNCQKHHGHTSRKEGGTDHEKDKRSPGVRQQNVLSPRQVGT